MDFYVFLWDMKDSTRHIEENEPAVLRFLDLVANFCLESMSELTSSEITSTGDGQRVIVPQDVSFQSIVLPFAESVGRYAESLKKDFPDYEISSVLSSGRLAMSPLGWQGKLLWELNTALNQSEPGTFQDLVN